MAGSLSDYAEAQIRKWAFSDSAVTRPTEWWLELYTAAPSDAGGGTAVTGGSYARAQITFDADGALNEAIVDFGTATADWGEVTHGGIFDDATLGNLWSWGPLAVARTISQDDPVRVPVGALSMVFD